MSKKHYSENWISPSHGELMIQEIPKYIKAYYERMKEYGTGIHITIGTMTLIPLKENPMFQA